jgi:tRNA G26 N,N-dimethylase Trm1
MHEAASHTGVREPPHTERVVEELHAMGHAASATHLDGRFVRTPAPAKDVLQAVRAASQA